MGIRTVAVYSDADARSSFVRAADTAVRLGPSPAAESYLRMDAILGAAATTGAEAIHPGYGFLAENAAFAEAVETAGLVWVGPPAAAMRALGDKARAKALAEANGVPVLPGYHGEAASDEELAARAAGIGFPLLVKASAGGGGRGMRVVRSADALPEALAGARREAAAAFGDDRLLLERYLELPRHVEVQVLGDAHGTLVHLGERECSVQRRHQKLIEESPSPAVSAVLRNGDGRRGTPADPRGRVPERRDRRVPARRIRGVLLPRGQRAAPGGAPGHRGCHRPRPRGAAAAGRGGRAAGVLAGRRARRRPRDGAADRGRGRGGRLPARDRRGHGARPAGGRARRHRDRHGFRGLVVLRFAARQGDRPRLGPG